MIKITLPIYHTFEFKRGKVKKRKDKAGNTITKTVFEETVIVGLNWYRNAFHIQQNNVKKHFHKLVEDALEGVDINYEGKYTVQYKLFYKTSSCDAMNIVPIIDKFLNDAIQEMGIVKNDNVKFYTKGDWEVAGQDKDNPRMEVEIKEIKG